MNSKKNAISLFTPEEAADYNDITNNFFTPIYPFIANHIIQLNKENISSADIAGYENEVFSHFEVGLAILGLAILKWGSLFLKGRRTWALVVLPHQKYLDYRFIRLKKKVLI